MKSVRTKLIITVVFFLVIGTGVLSGVSFLKTREILTANLEQSITAIAQSNGRETGMWLDARKAEIAVMANSPLVLSGRQDDIVAYLQEEIKRNKAYEMFIISDKSGKTYTSTGSTTDISDRGYFKEVLATGKPVVSDPVVSKASNKLVVVVAAPIMKNGSVSGLFGATVLVDELSQKVASIKMGKTGYAYMAQGNGMFIAHPRQDLVMKYNPLTDGSAHPKLLDAAKKMSSGETGVTRYVFDGVDKYMAYAPVPGTKWSLAVTAPVAELSEQLASLPFLYASIAIVTAAIIAVILALILGGMLGNLRRVAKEAVKIAEGDLTGREIPAKTDDEIGQLAGAFSTMLANLKDITGQLQEKSRSVAASATELMASAENVSAGAEETTSTISQVASSVEQVTGNARRISASSERAAAFAMEGTEGIQRIVAQMES
ncbi:MAG: methyl-accepting chemotaxis protein, partial [Bacillota bacterium]